MTDVEKEFIDIKKDISKCYNQNKVTKKMSWLSLPISLIILIISKLVLPLSFLNIIPIFLTFLNFLVTPTFKILKKIKNMTNNIKNSKDNLELEQIKKIYYEIKNFYTISEIPDKYLWISFLTIFISMSGLLLSSYTILLINLLLVILLGLLTSLGLSIKEVREGQKIVADLRNIVYELEKNEKNNYLKEEFDYTLEIQEPIYYNEKEQSKKKVKVLKK